MIVNGLTVENISNANDEFLNAFYKIINKIDIKLVNIIKSKNTRIILADKISDVYTSKQSKSAFKKEIEAYQEYDSQNSDKLSHGVCSDTINAICIFSSTTEIPYMDAILYHEIGHFIDFYDDWGKEDDLSQPLSSKQEFVDAYNNDITMHWDEIKKDNRFRLIHYIEDSKPNNVSKVGLCETFAFCFARNNNIPDDIDIISDYFQETVQSAKKITDEYLMKF